MNRSLDPHLIELESKIQILERENEALSAKAEENILLNRTFEEINELDDTDTLFLNTLESISVLLNIQFSGLFDFTDDHFTCVSSYALFSNTDRISIPFGVSEFNKTKVAAKETCFLKHSDGSFSFHYPDSDFKADHAVIIAIDSEIIKNRYFVFVNDEIENHLADRIPLFEKIIRIISTKLERIYYQNELVKLNEELEQKVALRTFELHKQNEEYLSLNEEYKRMNEELHFAKTEAEESEKKHRLLFENMTQGVIYQNSKGIVIFNNAAAAIILELDHEQISGKNSYQLFCQAKKEDETFLAEDEHPSITALKTGKKVTNFVMAVFVEKTNTYRWINTNAIPILKENSRKPHQVIVTFEDISERKQAEQEKLQKQKLEKEIAIAEESVRFKQNFLANMSHEIRTPLTGILGMTEILFNTRLDDEQSDYLNTIQQSGENLREIINNVLDFSKIEAGKMQLSKTLLKIQMLINNARNLFVSICKKPIIGSYRHHCFNGVEVLEIFEPNTFDLILMDIQMPVMDGITATQKLREKYTHVPPIVGLSANAFEGDREKYMAQGLDEYLTKPFQKEEFLNVVYKLFHSRHF